MNKRVAGIISVVLIVICLGYIIYDIATGKSEQVTVTEIKEPEAILETNWIIDREFEVSYGELNAIVVTQKNIIICAGNSFIASYDNYFNLLWSKSLDEPIFALAENKGIIYAAAREEILLFDSQGELIEKWGPYDDNVLITGLSANEEYVAIADAGNKLVFITDKYGALMSIIGYPGNQLIIPSAYFDVHLTDDNMVLLANTGKRSIEFRSIDGEIIKEIGQEGDELENFCGCCNPAHFDLLPDGNIVTAEKGINRLKIISPDGKLVEPIAQPAHFMASIPLDISAGTDGSVYGANRKDSKIYVFTRKN